VLTAPRPLPADLLDRLKAHKLDILAALAHPDGIAVWWRVAILEPGARTVEVDTPSGYVADIEAGGIHPKTLKAYAL
jgi:hypothetical protein